MQTARQQRGLNWQTLDKWCVNSAAFGLFCMVACFYLAPSYGEVARVFYVLVMLPALIALPYWLPRAQIISWPWMVFLIPIIYLAATILWIDDQHINQQRSLWYFFKPFLFLVLLLLSMQQVIQRYPNIGSYLVKAITVVALVGGTISLWQYLPGALEKDIWPRAIGISVNNDINVTASLYGINIVFCLYGLVNWTGVWRWVLVLSLLSSILVVVLTQSKAPFIYIIAAILWSLISGLKSKKHLTSIAVISIFCGIASFVYFYFDRIPLLDRVSSYSIRLDLWKSAILQSTSHLWFGYGVGSDIAFQYLGKDYPSHAHNFIIDTLRYGGIVGALLISAQVLYTGFCGVRILKIDTSYLPVFAWFIFGTLFLLTNGQQPLVKPHHIWFFYWLPVVLILGKDLAVKKSINLPPVN